MLREISQSEAIERFNNLEEVLIFNTKYNKMFKAKEFIETSRFLVDEKAITPKLNQAPIVAVKPALNDEPAEKQLPKEKDVIDKSKESADNARPVEPIDESTIRHTSGNEVFTEVEDPGYRGEDEPTTDNEDSYQYDEPGKKGPKIKIDLGKLYALRRSGWTIKAIAEDLHCSIATVNKYVNNTELEAKVSKMQRK